MYSARLLQRGLASAVRSRVPVARSFHASAIDRELSKFSMPAMSPTMTEGGIAQWKVKEGQSFSAGDVLLEIETDKATMDVEAQDDGVLAKIIVGDGSKNIQVGTLIAVTGEEGDDLSGAAKLAEEAAASAPEPKKEEPKEEPKKEEPKSAPSPPPKADTASAPPSAPEAPRERLFATPIARRLAQERGIPLTQIKGSGPSGRIVKEDVEKFKAAAPAGAPQVGAAAPQPGAPAGVSGEYEDIPVSNMRRTIASRLTESKVNLPHYYLTVEIDMDKVLKLREVFNNASAQKAKDKEAAKAAKLSVNDFIIKGVAQALREVPDANSAWHGDFIRRYKNADISVAVATPNGLITPIVKNAGAKGLATISAECKALAVKARDGKLAPAEYQGGTFTVSNLGMFGIQHFTAIINLPQSCILAIGSTVPKLVPDATSEKGFKTIQVMNATLSSDHRTVDGAVGAKWLSAFKEAMENPLSFML